MWHGVEFDINHSEYDSEVVEGVRVMTLPALLELKLAFRRPKDRRDIARLKALCA